MKRTILAAALSIGMTGAMAYNSSDATLQVQRYVSTVACEQASDNDRQQFKAVQISDGVDEKVGYGAAWAVYWTGQMGCMGGNSQGIYFTIVEMRGSFAHSTPVVIDQKDWPIVKMAVVEDFVVKNGVLEVRGIGYSPDDPRSAPTLKIEQRFKYVNGQLNELK